MEGTEKTIGDVLSKQDLLDVAIENKIIEIHEVSTPDVQSLPVTTAQEWRKQNLNVRKLQVPSGAVFLVKNVDFAFLITKGIVPLPILMSMVDLRKKTVGVKTESITSVLDENELKNIDVIASAVVVEAVLDPKISENGNDENSIPVSDLSFMDKMVVFQECVKGGQQDFSGFFRQT